VGTWARRRSRNTTNGTRLLRYISVAPCVSISVFGRSQPKCRNVADIKQGLAPSVIEIARADRDRRRRPDASL
jgi:hypothetical protein